MIITQFLEKVVSLVECGLPILPLLWYGPKFPTLKFDVEYLFGLSSDYYDLFFSRQISIIEISYLTHVFSR